MKPKLIEEVPQERDILMHYYMKHYRRAMRIGEQDVKNRKQSLFVLFRIRLSSWAQLRDFHIDGVLHGIGTVKNKYWKRRLLDPMTNERRRLRRRTSERLRRSTPPF